jgi:hypothetical protein
LARVQISINIDKTVIQVDSALLLFIAITETAHFAIITGLAEIPIKFSHTLRTGVSPARAMTTFRKSGGRKCKRILIALVLGVLVNQGALNWAHNNYLCIQVGLLGGKFSGLRSLRKVSEG